MVIVSEARQRAEAVLNHFDPDGDSSTAVPIQHESHVQLARDVLELDDLSEKRLAIIGAMFKVANNHPELTPEIISALAALSPDADKASIPGASA
jgi:hypothetical protein